VSSGYLRVCEAPTEFAAVALCDLLRQSGIAAELYAHPRDHAALQTGYSPFQSWGAVLVPASDLGRALELCKGFVRSLAEWQGLSDEELEQAALDAGSGEEP
jgi:hypothetical protein